MTVIVLVDPGPTPPGDEGLEAEVVSRAVLSVIVTARVAALRLRA